MTTDYYISKDRQLPHAQDFEYLRKEGLKYIEQLGKDLWTDYNPHDPGITILEILCYAITEIGYRAGFDIRHLLTGKNGKISNGSFFRAGEIFPNAPLTEIDYRKLLIDQVDVSNAWFVATQRILDQDGYPAPHENESPIYLNKLEDKLCLLPKDRNDKPLARLALRGLSKVLVALEEDPELGDLNAVRLDFGFLEAGRWVQLSIYPAFKTWNDTEASLLSIFDTAAGIAQMTVETRYDNAAIDMNIVGFGGSALGLTIVPADLRELNVTKQHFQSQANIAEAVSILKKKKEQVDKALRNVQSQLHRNRNLTEDYLCIETIRSVQIGICADIEIGPQSNVIDLMVDIHIAINDVINPPVRFYSLDQLLREGYTPEELFLGPRLSHGFLKDEEVEKAQLPSAINASDIIAAIMKIEGVVSVNNMLMTAYDEQGEAITESSSKPWHLQLSGAMNAVFAAEKSKLLLFRQKIPFLLSETSQMLVDQKIQQHRKQQKSHKLLDMDNELPEPSGIYYPLQDYYSIQDEFPINYGLGKNRLPEGASDKRKAQVKQLKGYLHFYDQILADVFNQLSNAKNVLDLDKAEYAEGTTDRLTRTYFPRYLDKHDLNGEDYYSKELYAHGYEDSLNQAEDNAGSAYESKSAFCERRNRSLDHLLARFSESFSDYVFMMYQVNRSAKRMEDFSFQYDDLLQDKQRFIREYPIVSSRRGLGMDYFHSQDAPSFSFEGFWGANYRGGYERRVARLLGINDIRLRNIAIDADAANEWTVSTIKGDVAFTILVTGHWDWFLDHMLDYDSYTIEKEGVNYRIYLIKSNDRIARYTDTFSSYEAASDHFDTRTRWLSETFESFYCIEHILLRPFPEMPMTDDQLLGVCLNDGCDDAANNDPYSFKATIVLPGYVSRFRNLPFRKYAEKIFRQEAPAGVLLKICWVSRTDMLVFQEAYKGWLENYRAFRMIRCRGMDTPTLFLEHHKKMIEAIKELNTIYPEGNLYDCKLGETDNPIVLDNTALGTL
jgi:hypothetical protein